MITDYDDPEQRAQCRAPVRVAAEPFLCGLDDLGRLKRDVERGYRKFAEKRGWRVTDPAGRDIKPRDDGDEPEARPRSPTRFVSAHYYRAEMTVEKSTLDNQPACL